VHQDANVSPSCRRAQPAKAKRALQDLDGRKPSRPPSWRSTLHREYTPKYEKAADCLVNDRETLLAFYDFPAEHWKHLRTTNPIESTFATVRHRPIRSKVACQQRPALGGCFQTALRPRRKAGGVSMATTSCQNSFSLVNIPTTGSSHRQTD